MNVEIGTVGAQFLSWEYLLRIFDIGFFAVQGLRMNALHSQYYLGPLHNVGTIGHINCGARPMLSNVK